MDHESGRVLGIDPGEKRIGLALSDPSRTIASPLGVIEHHSRAEDARRIYAAALEHEAVLIVLGCAEDWDGEIGFQGRRSLKLKEALTSLGDLPVRLWSEYGSTQAAQAARRQMNLPRKKRAGHLDDLAATVILQSFLDAALEEQTNEEN